MPGRRMFIVAGPPGGGKSSMFALFDFADRVFNADDRAAELNAGSYENIPLSVREVVNREFEEFVHANIRAGASFAVETTLRSTITFEQAKLAREHGFRVSMRYVALDTVERHIDRVMRRAARGGHSASENTCEESTQVAWLICGWPSILRKAGSRSFESTTTLDLKAARF